MTGIEPGTLGFRSERSTEWNRAAPQYKLVFKKPSLYNISFSDKYINYNLTNTSIIICGSNKSSKLNEFHVACKMYPLNCLHRVQCLF